MDRARQGAGTSRARSSPAPTEPGRPEQEHGAAELGERLVTQGDGAAAGAVAAGAAIGVGAGQTGAGAASRSPTRGSGGKALPPSRLTSSDST